MNAILTARNPFIEELQNAATHRDSSSITGTGAEGEATAEWKGFSYYQVPRKWFYS